MLVKATFAALLSIMSASAMAAQCEATIESNDAMQFNTKEMTVDKTCKEFTVHLKHVGQLPKAAMGHNRSEEHTSELQSIMRISYAVFCLKKKITLKVTNMKK